MYPANQRRWQADYDAYEEGLTRFVQSRVDPVEAEDILQDVWSAYASALERGVAIVEVRAWLYRVARNHIADLYRSNAQQLARLTEGNNFLEDPDWFGEVALPTTAVHAALAKLPAAQREVFERNVLGGETLREIADDLSVSIKTVISRKGYARKRLRQLLADKYFGVD